MPLQAVVIIFAQRSAISVAVEEEQRQKNGFVSKICKVISNICLYIIKKSLIIHIYICFTMLYIHTCPLSCPVGLFLVEIQAWAWYDTMPHGKHTTGMIPGRSISVSCPIFPVESPIWIIPVVSSHSTDVSRLKRIRCSAGKCGRNVMSVLSVVSHGYEKSPETQNLPCLQRIPSWDA